MVQHRGRGVVAVIYTQRFLNNSNNFEKVQKTLTLQIWKKYITNFEKGQNLIVEWISSNFYQTFRVENTYKSWI